MKTFKYYTIGLLFIFMGLSSCNDTYEFHEQYIESGETIYTNKVDSVATLSGNKRIQLEGYISNAFNVNEIIVYWNKGENSQTFSYEKSENEIDKLELTVVDLDEQSYEFDIYSKDVKGNKSVKVTAFGTVYGETYRSNLVARAINTFSLDNDSKAVFVFKVAGEYTRSTEIKYTNLSGVEILKVLLADELEIELEDVDTAEPIMYRTFYVPTIADEDGMETSIDEFDSDWLTYALPSIASILESVTIVPALGGVEVTWENPESNNIKFDFEYLVDGNSTIQSIQSDETTGVAVIAGLESGEQELIITIADLYGNSFGPIIILVAPIPVVNFDKTNWVFADFSSDEPAEANWGPPIQGQVLAMLDGDLSTFWQTAWNATQPDYPHYFTIDMGSEKTIASFEIFNRQGDNRGATKHEFWVSNDNITFTKVASFDEKAADNGNMITAAKNTSARYVKYIAIEGPQWFTFLAEINIYGIE